MTIQMCFSGAGEDQNRAKKRENSGRCRLPETQLPMKINLACLGCVHMRLILSVLT